MNPLLNNLRVLDLSRLLPGPYCTLALAQLGADIIKIEEPDGGDYARELSPEIFDIVNRGKKSVTLDLRQASDVDKFKQLVKIGRASCRERVENEVEGGGVEVRKKRVESQ